MDSLAELRERRALTLRELSEMSGVAADTINQIELGHRKARPSTLRKLAKALDIEIREFFEEPALSGKAEAPGTGQTKGQRVAPASAYRPRYSVPLHATKPAETVEEVLGFGYTPTIEEALGVLYGPWEEFVDRYVRRWEEKLEAGKFTLSEIDECWATLEDLSLGLSQLNMLEQGAMPPQPDAYTDAYGFPATRTGRAIYRINDLFGPLHDAIRSKFGDSELEKQRRKHAEQEAFVKDLAQRAS